MAVSCCSARVSPAFTCRSDPNTSSFHPKPDTHTPPSAAAAARSGTRFFRRLNAKPSPSSSTLHGGCGLAPYGLSSALILRFPPNFVRQLSTKARRNCSNIGVAQIVAASWSNADVPSTAPIGGVVIPPSASALDAAATLPTVDIPSTVGDDDDNLPPIVQPNNNNGAVKSSSSISSANPSSSSSDKRLLRPPFLNSEGSIAIHAGERQGRGIVTDAITTPVVNTTAYFFKKSDDLQDFKEGRQKSFEYGRYGNPTTAVLEEKISALEEAQSTVVLASGMCASTVMFLALIPAGGHLVTTTDCYRKTRIFIETFLPKLGIKTTVIDPADIDGLRAALDEGNVTLVFTESPTNPFLRCVDIKLVSELCHRKGALLCIDGTFATPLNQKAIPLGADLVLHSVTKYFGGHNDVIGGSISGTEKLITTIRTLHHVIGGTLNPNAAYLLLRGMKTLHLRVARHNETAMKMAELLEAHPKIARVYYPGLQSHPEHELAKRQMSGFGGVVSFEVDGDFETTKKFIDTLKIPYIAPSFGGCESIVDQPALMSYWDLSQQGRLKYGIKDNLVRFSFGLEDLEDIKADVLQALDAI